MRNVFQSILETLESQILDHNNERESLGSRPAGFLEIRLLGQFSLLANPELPKGLNIRATLDVDATVDGDPSISNLFRKAIQAEGLELDDLSSEIWIPPGATFISIYESNNLKVSVLDPVSALVSKAVKAPEKNRILIREALGIYGPTLADKLKEFGVNIEIFLV